MTDVWRPSDRDPYEDAYGDASHDARTPRSRPPQFDEEELYRDMPRARWRAMLHQLFGWLRK